MIASCSFGLSDEEPSSEDTVTSSTASSSLISHSGGSYIYRSPIEIPDWYKDLPGHEGNATVSMVVVFNLALAHHMLGNSIKDGHIDISTFESPYEFRSLIVTAAKLYEHALSLNWVQDNEDESPLFLLATVNNMGQAHQALEDMEQSKFCFSHLLEYLVLFIDQEKGGDIYEPFFASVLHLIFSGSSDSAAAA